MLFRNTLAQSSSLITAQLFSVILAPLMLGRFGLALFGVWAVTGALAKYAGLFDFGITRSLARFVALYHARGDRRGVQECVGLGLLAVTVVGALAAGAALLAAPLLTRQLGVLELSEMRIVLMSAVVIFVASAYSRVFAALPIGIQRMVPPNVAGVTGNVLNFGFSVGALALSSDLTYYAMANAAAEALRVVLVFGSVLVVWSGSAVAFPSMVRTREILGYGLKSQVDWISELINLQTDKIVIALLLGPAAAGAYEIAARVVVAVREVGVLTVSAMIPTATAQLVERGREGIPAFFRRYTLLTVSLAFPLFTLSCIGAPFLLLAWLGDTPKDADVILVVLTLASFVNITSGVGSSIALAAGQAGLIAWTGVFSAVTNIVLTVALAPLFGLWGVLAGTVIAMSSAALLLMYRFHRSFAIPGRDYARAVLPPAALSLGLAVPFAVFDVLVGDAAATRQGALALLTLVSLPYSVAYWLLASRLGYLPDRLTAPWLRRPPELGSPVGRARAEA
jgi:O-antigen/teichoic acid export membrane protein